MDPLDDTIAVLREQTEIEIGHHPRRGFRPASESQYKLIARVMEAVLEAKDEDRIAVLREVFPFGVRPVESTKHLSMAEASILIRFLFGLDEDEDLPAGAPVTPEARDFLRGLKDRLAGARRAKLIAAGQQELPL